MLNTHVFRPRLCIFGARTRSYARCWSTTGARSRSLCKPRQCRPDIPTTNDREFREPTLCVMPRMVPHRSNVHRFSLHVHHHDPNAAKTPPAPLLVMSAKLLLLTIDANSSLDGKVGHVPAMLFPRGSRASQRSVPRSQSPRAAIHHKNPFPCRRPGPIRMQRFTSPLNVAVAEPRC